MLAGVFVTLANMIVFIWKFTILYKSYKMMEKHSK